MEGQSPIEPSPAGEQSVFSVRAGRLRVSRLLAVVGLAELVVGVVVALAAYLWLGIALTASALISLWWAWWIRRQAIAEADLGLKQASAGRSYNPYARED